MLSRIEQMMREGQLPDPRTTRGLVVYTALGFGIGWWFGIN